MISHVKHNFRCSSKINFLAKKYNFKVFLTLWRRTMHMLHHGMLGSIPNNMHKPIRTILVPKDLILRQGYPAGKLHKSKLHKSNKKIPTQKKVYFLGAMG